jgi:hypothetical protein
VAFDDRASPRIPEASGVDSLATSDPELAWSFFKRLYRLRNTYILEDDDLISKAGRFMAKNPGIESLLEEQFKPVTKGFQTRWKIWPL